ncbi:MAG: DUF2277 domain-containing protein [Candidatus Dormibacteraeota bacterium]|nr:DUF2277 domain-containing protein [Candidatus Dormibacteraeota bacterium]
MCRSIKTLRGAEPSPTEDDVRAAALQFVRKVSGYRVPSEANREAFDGAVDDITQATERLLGGLRPGQRARSPQPAAAPSGGGRR